MGHQGCGAVTDKYTGEVAARVALADSKTIDQAIAASVEAAGPMRRLPPYERQPIMKFILMKSDLNRLQRLKILKQDNPERQRASAISFS